VGTGPPDVLGDGHRLFFAFHRTGTGNHNKMAVADGHITDGYEGILLLNFPTYEFIGPGNRNGILDPGQSQKRCWIQGAFIVQDADGDPVPAGYRARHTALGFNNPYHRLYLRTPTTVCISAAVASFSITINMNSSFSGWPA